MDIPLAGASYLELKVCPISEGAIGGAHGVWSSAKFSCSNPAPADEVAPVTTATATPAAPAATGWYTTAPTVTLAATDNVEVAGAEYQIGAGPWPSYTEPVTLPERVNSFKYRPSDAGKLGGGAGNCGLQGRYQDARTHRHGECRCPHSHRGCQ